LNSGGRGVRLVTQHTTVSTTQKQIIDLGIVRGAAIVLVFGFDESSGGSNRFSDVANYLSGGFTVIDSTTSGSPADRNYAPVGTTLELDMASSTYEVTAVALVAEHR